jgi:hypothetical protein
MTSVNVSAVTNTVTVVEGVATVVTITTAGPQGPAGIAGGTYYLHTQASPATTWTINHNLGFRPTVELLDSGSQEIDGEISHPTINQTVVTLNPATAGLARLL